MNLRRFALPLLLALSPASLGAQTPAEIIEKFRPNRMVWHLETTIDRTGSARENTSRNEGRETRSYERSLVDVVTVHACGQAGRWAVSGVTWSYKDHLTRREESVAESTTCPPPPEAMEHNVLYRMKNYPPDIKSPGDRTLHTVDDLTVPYPGQDGEALRARAGAGVMEMPGTGTAMLSVRAQMLLQHTVSDVEEYYPVCDEGVIRIESRTETCEPGCATTVKTTPPTENGSKSTLQTMPPLPWMAGFGERIAFDKDTEGSVSGSKVLQEADPQKDASDFQVTSVAHWTIEPVDPCEEVRRLIEQDLAWAEAYLDTALQQQAGESGAKMNQLVNQRMRGKHGKGDDSGGGSDVSVDLSVGEDCEIKGKEAFEEQQRDTCKPWIVTEALMAHERRHQRQCQWMKEQGMGWNASTGQMLGNNEGAAYLTGVAKALPWYRDNCPGETATLYARKAALEKKRQSGP